MHHRKPVLHEGEGDWPSEKQGGLSAAFTLRMPQWMRDALDAVSENPPPLDFLNADNAGGVAREFLAGGFLKHDLQRGYSPEYITDAPDLSDEGYTNEELHEGLDAQLRIKMPDWLRSHVGSSDIADGDGAAARELIALGYRLYQNGSFPLGEPTPPRENVLCPHCYGVNEYIWKRSFKFPFDLDDFFDELSRERENPYRAYIEQNHRDYGWDPTEITETTHPLYGIPPEELEADHPDVDEVVTVAHCHQCNHTNHIDEFVRAYYDDRHKQTAPSAPTNSSLTQ